MLENVCNKTDLSSMYLNKEDLDENTSKLLAVVLNEESLLQEIDAEHESLLEQLDWIALSSGIVVHDALIERYT